eukprot:CAMPEP_0202866046 /NCGR_PEP_ID=MMETSP1391-20130828/7104_1 /ASSEMBLY_ACC=CAM_ASM_000867 /TAXON_ID=1034604 /ORGANISM="Chlamydomonas leiostraca, Strain SAG 11-49" /LENGTH=244 /DNA_ID=CAMNT_0049545955 /DNA_START=16 /DNA_END=750 /DNA_ORIENTATION=+
MSRSASRLLTGLLAARRACTDLSGSALQGVSRVLANPSVASETSTSAISIARTFWSSAPSCSSSLVNILKDELKHENQSYAKPDVIASGPPAPFTLSEAPGDTMLTLTRTYQGEEISVDLHINNQPTPEFESDAEEETLNTVVFNVHVNKKDTSLVFECESDGTFVAINHVSLEPKAGIESESTYTGPVFDELDENLQREFRDFITARGVTPELGEFLRHLVYDKEQREYTSWLGRVADFVSSK